MRVFEHQRRNFIDWEIWILLVSVPVYYILFLFSTSQFHAVQRAYDALIWLQFGQERVDPDCLGDTQIALPLRRLEKEFRTLIARAKQEFPGLKEPGLESPFELFCDNVHPKPEAEVAERQRSRKAANKALRDALTGSGFPSIYRW